MTLAEFRQLWEGDGLHFVEEERRETDGATWILFAVTEPESTQDYGRHYALFVVINQAQEILAHNLRNLSERDGRPWREQVEEWWEEHLREGLVDEKGERVCA